MADKAKRRILEMDVMFISLVDAGANKKSIIWKSENLPDDINQDNRIEKSIEIVKADDERRMVYGIVYTPDEVDAHGDTATKEVIENMAYNFMRNSRTANVDRQHDYESDEGFVAESWIERDGELRMFPEEKEGTWAVGIKVENETTWSAIKGGRIGGISMAGFAQTEKLEDEERKSLMSKIWEAVKPEEITKDGRVISAKNAKKIKDVINLLEELIGDKKMKDKEQEVVAEETTEEVVEKEDTSVDTEIGEELLDVLIEEIENEETEDYEVEESEEVTELKKQLEEIKKFNVELLERLEALENSGNGLQSQEGQEEVTKSKNSVWSQFVPPEIR
jgi:hypothetical protein